METLVSLQNGYFTCNHHKPTHKIAISFGRFFYPLLMLAHRCSTYISLLSELINTEIPDQKVLDFQKNFRFLEKFKIFGKI